MRRFAMALGFACVPLLLVPLPVFAQQRASIVGVVRDATGAILPGVTVEASSPALIEQVRSAVTDGNGRYSINAGLDASTVTPGITAPDTSCTTPTMLARCCAKVRAGSRDRATQLRPRTKANRRMSCPPAW